MLETRRLPIWILVVVVLLTLSIRLLNGPNDTSIRTAGLGDVSTEPSPAVVGRPEIDWVKPIKGGRDVDSAADAMEHVLFEVKIPHFASPELIQVDGDEWAPKDRIVAMTFILPEEGGRLLVQERLSHMTRSDMQARADDPSAPPEMFQIVEVRGTVGLLITANDIGRVLWNEGAVLFDITGPSVTPKQVLDLAERF